MAPEKNPVFVVDILAALRRDLPEAIAVFVGSGSLEEAVRRRAAELDQSSFVHLLGWRTDVPEVMAASDWFILPHPEEPLEAFGIAVVEAQLAGLRLLVSGILDDPLLPSAAVRKIALREAPKVWAQAALDLWRGPQPSRAAAVADLERSPMNMDRALAGLLELHR
jgi:glycosyltransferase involved in cell wall biosynthesis